MWFRSNQIFWFKLPEYESSLLSYSSPPLEPLHIYFSILSVVYTSSLKSHWPLNLYSPHLCCLCPHHLLSSHLSSSLLSVSSFSSVLHILFFFFHPCPLQLFLPSFWILPVSSHVYSSLSPPLPLSNSFKPVHPCLLLYGSSPPSMPSGYLPPGSSPLLQSPQGLSQLTQQDDDAQQDGNQSPRAETRRGEERLALAHPDPAMALAWAHPQGQGAGATQRWLPTIPHHNGQLV